MTKYYTIILIISFIFISWMPTVAAAEGFGLAMHGNAKYSAEDTHLDYVNPDAPKGGDVKIAAIGTFDTLNPYSIKGIAPENMNLVYDRLMQRVWDEPFTMYPLIAEAADVSDDRSEVTFYINPKARFHDGSPITAEDVKYSYETLKEYGRPNMRRIYALADKVEIRGGNAIYFHFGDGYDRETVMIFSMMPVLSKAWWGQHNFDSTIMDIPLLNGPYRIKSADVGKKIVYERVSDYWAKDLLVNKGQYNFDTITYDYYRGDTVALEAFNKGDLDIRREWDIAKWQSAYGNLRADFVRAEIPHHRPERAHGFIFNLRRPLFNDVRVRKALALALDEDWVAGNIYHGQFKRVQSVFPNSVLAAPQDMSEDMRSLLEPYEADLSADILGEENIASGNYRENLRTASKLLEKAGWVVENGVRVHAQTKEPLHFELLVQTLQDEKIALAYKKSLQRLGVTMDIRNLDKALFEERKMNYDYDMIAFFWQNSLSPGTEQMLYWSCHAAEETARFNYAGICNPALDHFAGAIANAQSYDALSVYAHIIDRILMREYIMVPLFYKGSDYVAYRNNIHVPKVTPIYGMVMESWWHQEKEN